MNKKLSTLIIVVGMSWMAYGQTKTVTYQEIVTGSNVFFGAVMDQSSSTVTMTISGPDDRWFGVGFGTTMGNGDILMYTDGKSGATHTLEPTDYKLSSQNLSGVNKDAQQDWTIVSNTTNAGLRTIVATRALNTGDTQDNALAFTDATVTVIWAKHQSASFTLNYHGSTNRGAKQFTWVDPSAAVPSEDNGFVISQSEQSIEIQNLNGVDFSVMIVDMKGNVVYDATDLSGDQSISSDEFVSGAYIMIINASSGVSNKLIRL